MSHALDRRRFLSAAAAAPAALAAARPAINALRPAGRTRFAVNVEMWSFGGKSFIDRVRAVKELGFPAIEFWPWRNKPLDELKAVLDETGLIAAQFTGWGFSPGLNEVENHDRFEQEIRDGCAAAKKISCPMMTVVGGNDVAGLSPAQMHDNIIAGLKRVKPIVEDEGVMLILEPMNIRVDHKGHCLYGSPDAVRICREVDSPMVKINWDLYHMQISEGDLCRRLGEGFDQVGYLQVADNPGRHEPGTGEVAWGRVFKEAWDLGYRGFIGLECTPLNGEAKAAERVRAADLSD